MRSFSPGFYDHVQLSPELVQTIRLLGEHKGREGLFRKVSPQVLEALRKTAIVESTESSNRIEGIVASRERIEQLVEGTTEPQNRSEQEIAGYREVLDFLCIHPFLDGNGRMARLLSLLLLYQEGYGVGRYISLERVVERQREGYYAALLASSQTWHEGTHDPLPWWGYFLGVICLGSYRELETRTDKVTRAPGAKSEMVESTIGRLSDRFQVSDVERGCPGVSRSTIRRVLRQLRDDNKIRLVKGGREAEWQKIV